MGNSYLSLVYALIIFKFLFLSSEYVFGSILEIAIPIFAIKIIGVFLTLLLLRTDLKFRKRNLQVLMNVLPEPVSVQKK